MKREEAIDITRRSVAAINLLVSGPTQTDYLERSHVVVGGGPRFTPEEEKALGEKLVRYDRHMIYFEVSETDSELAFERMHIVAPGPDHVRWWRACFPCASAWIGEVSLVATDPGARGRFVSRNGALRYAGSRPDDLPSAVSYGTQRFKGIIQRLEPRDYSGQTREDLPGGGVRYWQHEGFRIL